MKKHSITLGIYLCFLTTTAGAQDYCKLAAESFKSKSSNVISNLIDKTESSSDLLKVKSALKDCTKPAVGEYLGFLVGLISEIDAKVSNNLKLLKLPKCNVPGIGKELENLVATSIAGRGGVRLLYSGNYKELYLGDDKRVCAADVELNTSASDIMMYAFKLKSDQIFLELNWNITNADLELPSLF
jgi:hypothetical protein